MTALSAPLATSVRARPCSLGTARRRRRGRPGGGLPGQRPVLLR